jgi:O-antigen ligase
LWFYNKIIDSPVYGSQFARLQNGEFPGYAHNIFLDILLGFGIIGLVIFLFVISKLLKVLHFNINNQKTFWIGLIMLQSLLLSLTSGAYYQDPLLNCSIVLTLLLINKKEILESEK